MNPVGDNKGHQLIPCPFCGSANLHVFQNAPSSDMEPWPHVACLECGTGQSTIAKWNTRAGYACDGWIPMTFFDKPLLVHPDIGMEAKRALIADAMRKIMELEKTNERPVD